MSLRQVNAKYRLATGTQEGYVIDGNTVTVRVEGHDAQSTQYVGQLETMLAALNYPESAIRVEPDAQGFSLTIEGRRPPSRFLLDMLSKGNRIAWSKGTFFGYTPKKWVASQRTDAPSVKLRTVYHVTHSWAAVKRSGLVRPRIWVTSTKMAALIHTLWLIPPPPHMHPFHLVKFRVPPDAKVVKDTTWTSDKREKWLGPSEYDKLFLKSHDDSYEVHPAFGQVIHPTLVGEVQIGDAKRPYRRSEDSSDLEHPYFWLAGKRVGPISEMSA